MNNQENLQRSVAVRPCVTEALIAPPSGKQTLKTQHRDVSRYLSRKMQSVISGSYSALDTSDNELFSLVVMTNILNCS